MQPIELAFISESDITYSIVIPLYNERDNVLPLVEELGWVMSTYKDKWELILVDDGSTDATSQVITELIETKKSLAAGHIRLIRLHKNYGQTTAFAAGIRAAKGSWIISLDGDGQNDPRDIPLLIETANAIPQGYDLVSGRRKSRQDVWYKRLLSKIANMVRKKVLSDNSQDTGCSLKLYKKSALEKIPLFHGMHRFLPALFTMEGFSIKEVPVHHRERLRGKSKYHLFNRGISLFFDMLVVAWMKKRKLSYKVDKEFP
jgi:dolichol-phosphate mannosyltransferase